MTKKFGVLNQHIILPGGSYTMKTVILKGIIVFLCVVQASFLAAQSYTNPLTNDEMPKRVEAWVPIRPITHGPGYHWFGYYDKLEFDPTGTGMCSAWR